MMVEVGIGSYGIAVLQVSDFKLSWLKYIWLIWFVSILNHWKQGVIPDFFQIELKQRIWDRPWNTVSWDWV